MSPVVFVFGQIPHWDTIMCTYFEIGFSYQLIFQLILCVIFSIRGVCMLLKYAESFFAETKSPMERTIYTLRVG